MTFEKIHLKLHRKDFIPAENLLPIVKEKGNYDRFIDLLTKVGEDSKWDLREVYYNPLTIKSLKQTFAKKSSSLWVFKNKDKDVGFCQTAPVEDLTTLFNQSSGISEIYKIGLFPEYIGKGLGKSYLTSVLTEIFKNHHTVYLNTRDTNVVNSVPFYQKLGFEVFKTEILPNDLIHG